PGRSGTSTRTPGSRSRSAVRRPRKLAEVSGWPCSSTIVGDGIAPWCRATVTAGRRGCTVRDLAPPAGWRRWHHGLVSSASRHTDRPILITEAPVNADDEYNRRRRRYLIMMIIRALCVIGAASTFRYSGWLAA